MTADPEEPAPMKFDVLKAAAGDGAAVARLGRLAFPGRSVVETPNFFANTSRGTIPHITPDNVLRDGHFAGVYMALEDFIGRSPVIVNRVPALYKSASAYDRPLHGFTALPESLVTVLGARRFPAVPAPMGNGANYVSVFTSTGFQELSLEDYHSAIEALKPDIAIPLADLSHTSVKAKRAARMAERTEDWANRLFARLREGGGSRALSATAIFAPTLPIEHPMQWEYLKGLAEDHIRHVSGLSVYDASIIPELASYPSLLPLPRLSLDPPPTPHHVLRQVSLGVDVFALPFVNAMSDAGVALTFSFPAPPRETASAAAPTEQPASSLLPLGVDMAPAEHQASLAPLQPGCGCYACAHHHRAFVRHLLSAREMLGWTLLQLHNHAAARAFFAGVRDAIGRGTFEEERARFAAAYEPDLPAGTGQRPRARGYHFKSEGADEKRNAKPWESMGGGAEEGVAGADVDMAETPIVPDESAAGLDGKGFAEIDREGSIAT